ncbi:MAG: DUF2807 domain-containing protein [Candidatus Delongbacteria bacterium]
MALGVSAQAGLRGNGLAATRPLELLPFHSVSVAAGLSVIVQLGSVWRGEISGDRNLLDLVELREEQGHLGLNLLHEIEPCVPLHVTLWSPKLERIEVGDAARLVVHGSLETLRLALDGAGQIRLAGQARELEIHCGGASRLDGFDCPAERVRATCTEAARAQLTVRRELLATCSGASQLELCGTPARHQIDCSGVALVRWRKPRAEAASAREPEPEWSGAET